ncbi:MAG: hypothetical protein LBT65_07085 [Synergistaceae bacterium]|nr:hypothetical protein [Synergistaceae bacterium]
MLNRYNFIEMAKTDSQYRSVATTTFGNVWAWWRIVWMWIECASGKIM